MRQIQVGGHVRRSKCRWAFVDNADYPRLNKHNWRLHNHGYAYRQTAVGGTVKTILMHREVLRARKGREVDHINGLPLDNRRGNLRLSSHAENRKNNRIYRSNTSGYKGVVFHHRCRMFQARIQANGRVISLGYYKSPETAAEAYNEAAKRYHGSFASLNVIIAAPKAEQLQLV